METGSGATDVRLGYAIILGLIVLASSVAMVLSPGELLGAGGFALATLAGLALVVALHLFD